MIINGKSLLNLAPIHFMEPVKKTGPGGTSYGLGEAGYDIRIKQEVIFKANHGVTLVKVTPPDGDWRKQIGRFTLASAMECFLMPPNLVGVVHDKSTWARRGLQVFNTVIEPGWQGYLTLELAYWGEGELIIPAGAGIAQVVFTQTSDQAFYSGKYQGQEDRPVPARDSK